MTILSDRAPKFILKDTELTHFHFRGPLISPSLWAIISSSDHTFHSLTDRFITTFLSLKTAFPLPEKCPFSLVQRPLVFCQRFSEYLGFAHYRFFHQLTTIYGTSNNGSSGTSLFLIPNFLFFHFFTSPFYLIILSLFFPCRAGIAVPAHTPRGWVAQRMGDPRRLPNPLGHAPNGDLQKLFFHNFSSDNFK